MKVFAPCLIFALVSCASQELQHVGSDQKVAKPAEFEEVPGLEAEDPYPRRYERHVKWEVALRFNASFVHV